MSRAVRSRSTTTIEAPTAEPATTAHASLGAHFVRPGCRIEVTFAKPMEHGRPEMLTGSFIGTMHARGAVHHHRVAVDGVIWFVPPMWLTPAAGEAVRKATCPVSGDAALIERMQALLTALRNRRRAGSEAGA